MNRPKHNRWLLTLFLVCAIILSLPRPKANAQNFVNNRFNVVVVLDASGSMKNTDPNGLRYEAISQFFGLLAEQGNALGGVVFHTELAAEETLTEITDQSGKDTVMDMLKSIPSNGGWTNTGAGLARAVEMIKQDGAADLPSVILFLSDGNTAMASKEETQASLDQKAEALQAAREQGIQIYSVCLNANKGADVSEMQQLADATGGVFREVTKAEDLQDVFNTFYDLIYGTSTITVVDDYLPDSGRLETPFEVPGIGVEEVNIIVYGNTTKMSLLKPDGSEGTAAAIRSKTFSLLKLTDVEPGMWTLITEGVPGDSIKVNMVYNTNLGIELSVAPEEKIINPVDSVTITAKLKGNNVLATNGGQYVGYTANLHVLDAYGELLESIPMEVVDDRFEVIRIRRIAVFCVIALLQQKKPAAQFALPNQMSGFQSFIEIQLQKRLQMLCFVVFKNPELPRIRCCFPRHEMDPGIIKECIISGAFYRIGDPLVPEFRKEKSVQGRNILVR